MSLSLAYLASPWKLHQVQRCLDSPPVTPSVSTRGQDTPYCTAVGIPFSSGGKNVTMKRILSCERCLYQNFSFQLKKLSPFLLFLVEETAKEITRESKTGQETAEEITRESKTGLKNSTTLFQILKMFWEGLEADLRSLFSYLYFLQHINSHTHTHTHTRSKGLYVALLMLKFLFETYPQGRKRYSFIPYWGSLS